MIADVGWLPALGCLVITGLVAFIEGGLFVGRRIESGEVNDGEAEPE